MTLSKETENAILKLQKSYPQKRSALIPALHLAQAEVGYLPMEVQAEVASLFEVDPNEVNGIVSFYDMFSEKKQGKHLVHVCKNASCMLRGADEILQSLCLKLGVKPGEMTSDGEFSVIPSECLAACDRAPFLLVDDEEIGPVQECHLDSILEEAKGKKGHASPIEIGEIADG